jgi:hypothetical protein
LFITPPTYSRVIICRFKLILGEKMNSKPIAVGLVFGVGLGLALKSWLLGIMFGIIFYVALNEAEKKEDDSSSEEEE